MAATSGSTGNVNDDSETGHRFADDVGAVMTVILPRPYTGGVGVTDRIRCEAGAWAWAAGVNVRKVAKEAGRRAKLVSVNGS